MSGANGIRTGIKERAIDALSSGAAKTIPELATVLGVDMGSAKNALYMAGWRIPRGSGAAIPKAPRSETRLRVVQSDSPGFERCHAAGGPRRETCVRYEECLDAEVRRVAHSSGQDHHVRCPAACAFFVERDRTLELWHFAASRPGEP